MSNAAAESFVARAERMAAAALNGEGPYSTKPGVLLVDERAPPRRAADDFDAIRKRAAEIRAEDDKSGEAVARNPEPEPVIPAAAVYDFFEIAGSLFLNQLREEMPDLWKEGDCIERPKLSPAAVYDFDGVRHHLALMRGEIAGNRTWTNPMLTGTDAEKAMYLEWAKEGEARWRMEDYRMHSHLKTEGHRYNYATDGCDNCGLTFAEIEDFEVAICPGDKPRELCIECGKRGYVSLTNLSKGARYGTKYTEGRCVLCGYGHQTEVDNPRKGFRFEPPVPPTVLKDWLTVPFPPVTTKVMGAMVQSRPNLTPADIARDDERRARYDEGIRKYFEKAYQAMLDGAMLGTGPAVIYEPGRNMGKTTAIEAHEKRLGGERNFHGIGILGILSDGA